MRSSDWKLFRSTQNKKDKLSSIVYEVGTNKEKFNLPNNQDETDANEILNRNSFHLVVSNTEEGGMLRNESEITEIISKKGEYVFKNFDIMGNLEFLVGSFEPNKLEEVSRE
jgi:hypothetical protein